MAAFIIINQELRIRIDREAETSRLKVSRNPKNAAGSASWRTRRSILRRVPARCSDMDLNNEEYELLARFNMYSIHTIYKTCLLDIGSPCRTATLSILQVPDLDCRLTTVEVFARNDRLKTNRQRFLLVVIRTMLSFITEYDRNLRFLSHRESFGALEIRKSSVASRVLRYSRDQRKFCRIASPSVLSRSEKVLSHRESFGTLEIRESSVTSVPAGLRSSSRFLIRHVGKT